jgi:uncharacterized repeat protein (TIGR01451 family)
VPTFGSEDRFDSALGLGPTVGKNLPVPSETRDRVGSQNPSAVQRFLSWALVADRSSSGNGWKTARDLAAALSLLVLGAITGYFLGEPPTAALRQLSVRVAIVVLLTLIVIWVAGARKTRQFEHQRRGTESPPYPFSVGGTAVVLAAAFLLASAVLVLHPWSQSITAPSALRASEHYWISAPAIRASDGLAEQSGVLNASNGGTGYEETASASYDQVLDVVVSYFGCHTNRPLSDVTPIISWSKTAPTTESIVARITDGGGYQLSQTVQVHLETPDAYLEFKPGTLAWEHARTYGGSSYETSALSDSALFTPSPLETIAANGGGAIVLAFREVVPGIAVHVESRGPYSPEWTTSLSTSQGSDVEYRITIWDDGDTPLSDLSLVDELPAGLRYIQNSAVLSETGSKQQTPLKGPLITNTRVISSILRPFRCPNLTDGCRMPNGEVPNMPGAFLPSVSPGKNFESLLGGHPASLLPGQTATVEFEARVVFNPAPSPLDFAVVQALDGLSFFNDSSIEIEAP